MTRPAGRIRTLAKKLADQVGAGGRAGREMLKLSRVGSGFFVTSRVEPGHPDPIRPARLDPTRENPGKIQAHSNRRIGHALDEDG